MKDSLILFGGTFNPLHNGHMAIAIKLHEVFNHCITFLPTGIPPYKTAPLTTAKERLEMLQNVIDGDDRFSIDTCEIHKNEFCYTYKTLKEIRNKVGNTVPIFFIIGSDSLVTLDTWDNWTTLFDLTNFIIIKRPNYNDNSMNSDLLIEYRKRLNSNLDTFKTSGNGQFYIVDLEPINISSTQIRNNIKHNQSIRELVPAKINEYILTHNLYAQ